MDFCGMMASRVRKLLVDRSTINDMEAGCSVSKLITEALKHAGRQDRQDGAEAGESIDAIHNYQNGCSWDRANRGAKSVSTHSPSVSSFIQSSQTRTLSAGPGADTLVTYAPARQGVFLGP